MCIRDSNLLSVLEVALQPEWLGIMVEATHSCMAFRGARAHEANTATILTSGETTASNLAMFQMQCGR